MVEGSSLRRPLSESVALADLQSQTSQRRIETLGEGGGGALTAPDSKHS